MAYSTKLYKRACPNCTARLYGTPDQLKRIMYYCKRCGYSGLEIGKKRAMRLILESYNGKGVVYSEEDDFIPFDDEELDEVI